MSEKITNYITISRKLFSHVFFSEQRVFSRFEAWIDLLQEARYELKEGSRFIGGKVIKVKRGEIPASLRFLAERWGWSKNKVDSFIKLLESEQMIIKRTAEGTAQTVITICKYSDYNPLPSKEGTASGTGSGQGRDNPGTGSGQSSNIVNTVNTEKVIGARPEIPFSEQLRKNELESAPFNRKPVIPSKDEVWEYFFRNGGTKEMAKAFYDSHEGTEWYYRGSPIIKFQSLAGKFIASWHQINEKNKPKETVRNAPTLKQI